MPASPAPKRSRNREQTERAILAAAKQVLAEDGFQGFGVNAIARKAGCDKQLVYRYFGGVDGLIEAIGADLANWWRDSLKPVADLGPAKSYGQLIERLALGCLDALRGDHLVQKIAVWEISDPSPQVARLNASRSKGLGQWIAAERGALAPPDGVDAPAINALLIGAIQHLVLASSAAGHFAGASLKKERDWDRIRAAVKALVAGVYGR
jgi:AcrR family transcriptional regulator